MRLLIAMLGTAGLGSVILMLAILARLTKRWEAVTRTDSHYRLFYVAGALVALASLARMVRIGHLYPYTDLGQVPLSFLQLDEPESWFYLLFYHLPLAIAMTMGLVVAWRNWGWLFATGVYPRGSKR